VEERVVARTYRRKRDSGYQEWHCHHRCTQWPSENYDIAYSEPQVGKVCRHCERLTNKKKVRQW
jgi:hypothetical protein